MGLTCILTRDRLFAESVGRMLDEHPGFSIGGRASPAEAVARLGGGFSLRVDQ